MAGTYPHFFLSADAEVWLMISDKRCDIKILNICLKIQLQLTKRGAACLEVISQHIYTAQGEKGINAIILSGKNRLIGESGETGTLSNMIKLCMCVNCVWYQLLL